jgi:hypothetical protein
MKPAKRFGMMRGLLANRLLANRAEKTALFQSLAS